MNTLLASNLANLSGNQFRWRRNSVSATKLFSAESRLIPFPLPVSMTSHRSDTRVVPRFVLADIWSSYMHTCVRLNDGDVDTSTRRRSGPRSTKRRYIVSHLRNLVWSTYPLHHAQRRRSCRPMASPGSQLFRSEGLVYIHTPVRYLDLIPGKDVTRPSGIIENRFV